MMKKTYKSMKNIEFLGLVEHDSKEINLYHTHIKVPIDIHAHFKSKAIKRIIFQLNHGPDNHAGFMPIGDGNYFLILSKKVLNENKVAIGEKVQVSLRPDTTKYGMPICNEMKELLAQDDSGSKYFHELTDGKIRSLLYKVNGYKSGAKRLEKALIILEHLKVNGGKLDWKMLNQAFKQGIDF